MCVCVLSVNSCVVLSLPFLNPTIWQCSTYHSLRGKVRCTMYVSSECKCPHHSAIVVGVRDCLLLLEITKVNRGSLSSHILLWRWPGCHRNCMKYIHEHYHKPYYPINKQVYLIRKTCDFWEKGPLCAIMRNIKLQASNLVWLFFNHYTYTTLTEKYCPAHFRYGCGNHECPTQ